MSQELLLELTYLRIYITIVSNTGAVSSLEQWRKQFEKEM